MTEKNTYPAWFLWLLEHGYIVWIFGFAVLALLAIGVYGVENRISDIEDQLSYAPPRSYSPPNLENYDAGDVSIAQLTNRRIVYAPVYSHIYFQGGSAYPLETTLSIRNVDISSPVYIESVEYYDTDGKLTKSPVKDLIKLRPLQTIEFLIERRDSTGGSGANFLIRWGSEDNVEKPLIETLMVGTAGTQGISFARAAVELSATIGDRRD